MDTIQCTTVNFSIERLFLNEYHYLHLWIIVDLFLFQTASLTHRISTTAKSLPTVRSFGTSFSPICSQFSVSLSAWETASSFGENLNYAVRYVCFVYLFAKQLKRSTKVNNAIFPLTLFYKKLFLLGLLETTTDSYDWFKVTLRESIFPCHLESNDMATRPFWQQWHCVVWNYRTQLKVLICQPIHFKRVDVSKPLTIIVYVRLYSK